MTGRMFPVDIRSTFIFGGQPKFEADRTELMNLTFRRGVSVGYTEIPPIRFVLLLKSRLP